MTAMPNRIAAAPKTYGAITFLPEFKAWQIVCEPHVSMRLKRVFGKLDKGSTGAHLISDTPENAEDILWFLRRYPMVSNFGDYLTSRAQKSRESRAIAQEIIYSPDYTPPEFELAIPAREYQKTAAALWLARGGLLLCDSVGLGKSCSAICGLTDKRTLPALIVTLTHLPLQWQKELARFAPKLDTVIVKSGKPYDLRTFGRSRQPHVYGRMPDVIIINYHKLSAWAETLISGAAGARISAVVFDEAQELRKGAEAAEDKKSAKYQAAEYIAGNVPFRCALSATPIYNFGAEFFSVVNIVCPGELGEKSEFAAEWIGGAFTDKATIKDTAAFGSYLRDSGIMLRRTRKDVGRELPEAQVVMQYVESNEEALNKVRGSCAELARLILDSAKETERGRKMQASEELSNLLRQATGIAKAPFCAEFVRLLLESGEKVVLYGWHRSCYAIWMDMLSEFKPAMYTGSETTAQKEEAKRRFVDGETDLLIISLRSGAGLDGLQKVCHIVCFGELDWSSGVHEQCLSEDTEVLTPRGFMNRDAVNVGDQVCGFDIRDGSIHWVETTAKTDRLLAASERMFGSRTEKIDIRVTGDHRMVTRRLRRTAKGSVRSGWGVETAKELTGKSRRFVPTCGLQSAAGVPLTDYELRLIGWFLTDGGLNLRTRSLHIYQAAGQPWNSDIEEVLNGCGLIWSRTQRTVPSGTLMNTYCIPKKDIHQWSEEEIKTAEQFKARGLSARAIAAQMKRTAIAVEKKLRKVENGHRSAKTRHGRGWGHLGAYLDKNLSPLLESVTREQLLKMIHGIEMGDGNKSSVNVIRVTNTNKTFLDRLQSLCVRRGLSANISTRKTKTRAGNLAYDILISMDQDAGVPRGSDQDVFGPREDTRENERVWCVSNELGTLVTRRKGKVSIVGNCVGRVWRDGQEESVLAYYLVSEFGSDPTMCEVLGIKKQQLEGVIRNSTEEPLDIVEKLQTDGGHIKRLAQAYLERRVS